MGTEKKRCFVITPVGEPDSEIRKKADGVINAIIKPVLEELKYEIIVPHEMSKSGSITRQIINELINDELVIANLTGLNANVMYELAIRHCIKMPVVCIIERNTPLPFDVSTERFIKYEDNFSNVVSLRNSIINSIKASEKDSNIDNPIFNYIKDIDIIKKISESNDPNSNVLKLILSRLVNIEKNINNNFPYNKLNIFNNDSYALIKLGDDKINSEALDKAISVIAKNFLEKNVTVAIVCFKDKNEIKVLNANLHAEILDLIKFELAVDLGFVKVSCEMYPF